MLLKTLSADRLQPLISKLLVLKLLHESIRCLVGLRRIVILLSGMSHLRVVVTLKIPIALVLGERPSLLAGNYPSDLDEIVLSSHRVLLLLFYMGLGKICYIFKRSASRQANS
jgi:hypothetical protein